MTKVTPVYQLPYLDGNDGGKHIKAVSSALALRLEAVLQNEGQLPLDSDLVSLLERVAALEDGGGSGDTGWVPVSTIGSGWTADATNPPRIRRVGDRVDLQGYLNYGNGSWGNMLTVPSGFRLPANGKADPAGFVISLNGLGIKLALSPTTHVIAGTLHFGSVNPTVVPIFASWYVS